MAASDTYIIKSVTFKSTALTGVEDVSISESGDVVDSHHDSSVTVTATFIDKIKATVRVTGRNLSFASNSNYGIGANGSLVVVFQKRASGKGVTVGSDKTATFADATLISPTSSASSTDRSTLELEFQCVDPNNTSPCVWS
jgi:hypothetical protein